MKSLNVNFRSEKADKKEKEPKNKLNEQKSYKYGRYQSNCFKNQFKYEWSK